MSERRSFEQRSERRSFLRERKVSAVFFRDKERKVSAAPKNQCSHFLAHQSRQIWPYYLNFFQNS